MLKSKLRKTGVCRHLRTQSLENACYSSTTRPTLSTLFLQNVPDCPPEALSFLPRFAGFYSIYYIQAVAKTHFLQIKNFYSADGKAPCPPVGRRVKRARIPVTDRQRIHAKFPRFRGEKQRFYTHILPPFPAASDGCFGALRALFSNVFRVVFYIIIYRAGFTANRRFRQMPMNLAAEREERVFLHCAKHCTAEAQRYAVGKAGICGQAGGKNLRVPRVLYGFG